MTAKRGAFRITAAGFLGILVVSAWLWPHFWKRLFSSDEFMPHGMCFLWNPRVLWLHATSDFLIGMAYVAISVMLLYFFLKYRGLSFSWIIAAFGVFIVACGATHLMAVVTLWTPVYWLSGAIKAVTAVASLTTAFLLPPLIPKALALPNPETLMKMNEELARSQSAYAERNEILESILDSMGDGVAVVNAQGKFILSNPAAERILGTPVTDAPSNEWPAHFRLYKPDLSGPFPPEELALARALRGEASDGVNEAVLFQGDSKPRFLSLSGRPLWDEAHTLRGGVAVFRDVTQQREDEQRLRESEERVRLLIEKIRDYAIFMLDPQGRVISWNEGAQRLKGYAAYEILGRRFSCFYPEEDVRDGKPERELVVAREQGSVEDEGWRVRKDGSKFWANVMISPIYDDQGNLRGFTKITRDLTQRKLANEKIQSLNQDLKRRVEELATLNKEMEAFSYSVSHDLRAPLRSIDGFSQALLEDYSPRLDDEGKEMLRRVRAATQRMGMLIDDLLELSRITRKELHREAVDLSRVAKSIVQELRNGDPRRQVECTVADNLRAEGDSHLLRIALQNLIANAWKFTGRRDDAKIEVGRLENGDAPVFFVRDNGVGFDPNYKHKLFGAFQRLHGMKDFPGAGVGLATVQRIVHRHAGRVWADAEVGKGATFYFTLNDSTAKE